ncbi:MAG: C-terminal binding protein [Phycisphaerae bacterium]|nr:C-terminal binding protein [Phycisphaerae bacterium]
MAKKVAVTDYTFDNLGVEESVLKPLGCELVGRQCKTEQELIDLTHDADYVITQFARVNANVIGAMEKCRIIVRYGIGVDNVDLQAAAAKDIPVCNVPDYCIDEVADHTLAMSLSLTRQLFYLVKQVKTGTWKFPVDINRMHGLKDMTVGVVGFGRIGREVALRFKAFKCKVLVFDPVVEAGKIKGEGFEPADLARIYAESDLVTLHCPSTAQTKQMINAQTLAKMKDGVLIVNLSRGDLVHTDDLIAALRSGKVSGAALDVTDPEPINPDNPLLAMDNVIITNHIASASPNAVRYLRKSTAERVACAVRGEALPNVVNGVKR